MVAWFYGPHCRSIGGCPEISEAPAGGQVILTFARYRGRPPLKVLIDDEDADRVLRHTWHLDTQGYVTGYVRGRLTLLHRFILNMPRMSRRGPPVESVDHINGDKTDVRKCNLRLGTRTVNRLNSRPPRNNTSGVSGVYQHPNGRWEANWKIGHKRTRRYFATRGEAVACRMAFNESMGLLNATRTARVAV